MENMNDILERIRQRNTLIKQKTNVIKKEYKGFKNASILLMIFSLLLLFLIYAKKDENGNFLKEKLGIEANFAKVNKTLEDFIDNFMVYEYELKSKDKENFVGLSDSYIKIEENKYINSSMQVYSVEDGVVTDVKNNLIIIEHDEGYICVYKNIYNPNVYKYDRVKEYQNIAFFQDYIELNFYKDGIAINYEEIYS